jgi:hypothetical protein
MAASSPFTPAAARTIRRIVTGAVLVIALLTFAFGFGNGWQLGLSLGVPGWIAPLVAPAVDLSVAALLATLQYLRAHGVGGRLAAARLLLALSGLITFGINTAHAILSDHVGQACFDAIAPLLLIGWSEVGPRLLGLLHQPISQPEDSQSIGVNSSSVTEDRPGPSPELIGRARALADEYQRRNGRAIPRDKLRAQLHVSNATAGQLLRLVRAQPNAQ